MRRPPLLPNPFLGKSALLAAEGLLSGVGKLCSNIFALEKAMDMFRVIREIEFCYGHRLLNYEGKCRYLHGHNARALVVIEGTELNGRGMLLDFAEIKDRLQQWIEHHLDHRMILHRQDPVVPVLQKAGETMYLLNANPTAENIARLIYQQAHQLGLPVVEVAVWETPRCQAVFRPEASTGPSAPGEQMDLQGELVLPRNPGPVQPKTHRGKIL